MKPNGKMFAVRVVLFIVCAVGLFSALAGAETVRGTFKLPVTAHWGKMVLAPGEYDFYVDTGSITRVVTIHSKSEGWSGMILARTIDTAIASGSQITLKKSGEDLYVQRLCLQDAGLALDFTMPNPAMTKLAKSASPGVASASGTN